MLDNIRIRNFKSIDDLSIDLGRFNVFIGENGCGKSNILEGMVFAAAALARNVENDFLSLRGARVAAPQSMRSGFDEISINKDILIDLTISDAKVSLIFANDNQPFSKWNTNYILGDNYEIKTVRDISEHEKVINQIKMSRDSVAMNLDNITKQVNQSQTDNANILEIKKELEDLLNSLDKQYNEIREVYDEYLQLTEREKAQNNTIFSSINAASHAGDFIIFSPENFFLRNFSQELNYVEPIGHRGEGLLKLIKIIKQQQPEQYKSIIEHLSLIDWFDTFDIKEDALFGETEFTITDKYLEDGLQSFDIRNANEGFLFLLFYITLFTSDYTPSFFAIDNIDTALNPKLCSKLITILSELAVKHNKQVIITTHNPSVLDGLNLNNDEERLFVIARNANGNTRANRIGKKAPLQGEQSVKLSEQFLRGYIGGLPKNF